MITRDQRAVLLSINVSLKAVGLNYSHPGLLGASPGFNAISVVGTSNR